MADSMHNDSSFNPFDPAEPSRDEALAAVLRRATGDVPVGAVDWDALASRIARALPGRSATTWWGYAERWSRRMLPIALAATLVGAFALWEADEPSSAMVASSGASDVVVDLVQGAPAEDAARSFARTVTANVILVGAEQD
jgi:transcriptional regulator GlxA family with amidase domain